MARLYLRSTTVKCGKRSNLRFRHPKNGNLFLMMVKAFYRSEQEIAPGLSSCSPQAPTVTRRFRPTAPHGPSLARDLYTEFRPVRDMSTKTAIQMRMSENPCCTQLFRSLRQRNGQNDENLEIPYSYIDCSICPCGYFFEVKLLGGNHARVF